MSNEQRDYWFESLTCGLKRGMSASEALTAATVDTAQVFQIGPERCEHDVIDGEYCEPCNKEYKRAADEAAEDEKRASS